MYDATCIDKNRKHMKAEKGNLFENMPAVISEELFESLVEQKGLKIERIVSQGHSTPPGEWYGQPWDEWVLLLQGEAKIGYADGQIIKMEAGDYLRIPACARHRVEWTPPDTHTVWLAIHYAT